GGGGGELDVSSAVPTIEQVWPPNHGLVSVGIAGLDDIGDGPIEVRITSVRSDEPVGGSHGDRCPDAFLDGATTRLRAERSGGSGRIYTLYFTATDSAGRSGSGHVTVCVPHDQGSRGQCSDTGASYDATGCTR